MSEQPSNPAVAFERLRAETATLLKLDLADDLPLTQSLQLDLVSLLRLEVGDLQGKVLAGDTVDLNRLAVAFGMLQKLLPPAELKVESSKPDFEGARQELERFLTARHDALEHAEEREVHRLRAEVARLRGEGTSEAARAPGEASVAGVAPAPARVAYIDAAVVGDPDPPAPPPPTPPKTLTPAQVAERIKAEATKPRDEPWRQSYSTPFGIHNIPRGW